MATFTKNRPKGAEPVDRGNAVYRMGTDDMRARGTDYQRKAEEVGRFIIQMDGVFADLAAEWNGAAAALYAERYEKAVKPHLIALGNLVAQVSKSYSRMADALDGVDADLVAAVQEAAPESEPAKAEADRRAEGSR